MKCANKLCIHNFRMECELEEIEIDWRGNCTSMKHIHFTQNNICSNKFYTHIMINNNYTFDKSTGTYLHLEEEK